MAKPVRTKNKDNARRAKKKVSLLLTERVEYVDYKDVNLLRRFMSDRAKIRARRVTGNRRPAAGARSPGRSRTPARWRCCPTPAGSPRPAAPSATASAAAAASATATCRRPTPSR